MDAKGQTTELTDEELEMIQRSLLVVIPRPYIDKILTSERSVTEEYYPTRNLEPSSNLAEPASSSYVIVIEPDVESSVTQSLDKLNAPKRSSVANGNSGFVALCTANGRMVSTATVGSVTMASGNPAVNIPALCNDIVKIGVPVNRPPEKNVDSPDLSTHALHNDIVKNGVPVNCPPGKNIESPDVSTHVLHDDIVKTGVQVNSPPRKNVESPDVSTLVLYSETVKNGVPEHSSTEKHVDMNKVSAQAKIAFPESTNSSNVDSRQQILSGCKSPVELYMAAAPTFLKADTQRRSSSTSKPESLFSPSQLQSIRLKAEPESVSALFMTFRRSRSQSGRSTWKLFNHKQVLTSGDECSGSSSPTAYSFVSSDSDSPSCCNLRGDLEDCADTSSIPARSSEALFQKPLMQPRFFKCRKRKLFNSSELLCPAVNEFISPERASLSGRTVSPVRGKTMCSLQHTDNRLPKTHGTVIGTGSSRAGEEVLSSVKVPVGKLYSETLTLLKKRSLERLVESVTKRVSVRAQKAPTDKQKATKADVTTEKRPKTQLVDGKKKLDVTTEKGPEKQRVVGETKLDVTMEKGPKKQLDCKMKLDVTNEKGHKTRLVHSKTKLDSTTEKGPKKQLLDGETKLDVTVEKGPKKRLVDREIKLDVTTEKSTKKLLVDGNTKLDTTAEKGPKKWLVDGETTLDVTVEKGPKKRLVDGEKKLDVATEKGPNTQLVDGEKKLDVTTEKGPKTQLVVGETKLDVATENGRKKRLVDGDTKLDVFTKNGRKKRLVDGETKLDVTTEKGSKKRLVDGETKLDVTTEKGSKKRLVDGETKLDVTAEKGPKKCFIDGIPKLDTTTEKDPKKQLVDGETKLDVTTEKGPKKRLIDGIPKLDTTTEKDPKKQLVDGETKLDVTTEKGPKKRLIDGITKLDATTEKDPKKWLVDGSNSEVTDQLPVNSDIVNAVRIQELLNANHLSTEQQRALNNKPLDNKLRRFTISYFTNWNS